MTNDPHAPCVLASVSNEIEAAAIVSALAAYDIEATFTGGFTAGFKAEAPGLVQIVVRQTDLDRAKQALAEIQANQGNVDWSAIDVGEPEGATDAKPNENPTASAADSNKKDGNSGCLILFLLAMPVIDTVAVLTNLAEPYANVIMAFGWCGFVCGAASGAYVSVRIKKKPWWSSCRWAIYGLLGMFLFVGISVYVSVGFLKTR